jgi:hypothetical protein
MNEQTVEENFYRAPAAVVADQEVRVHKFYVVSPLKFWVLMFVTLSLYRLYWTYKNWALYKASTGTPMWPIMRAVFPIFFIHSLYAEVDAQLEREQIRYDWAWRTWAAVFILGSVVENIASRLEGKMLSPEVSFWLQMLGMVVAIWTAYLGQRAINVAVADPRGESNSRFTVGNWIWIVLGTLFWLLILIGLMVPVDPMPS